MLLTLRFKKPIRSQLEITLPINHVSQSFKGFREIQDSVFALKGRAEDSRKMGHSF